MPTVGATKSTSTDNAQPWANLSHTVDSGTDVLLVLVIGWSGAQNEVIEQGNHSDDGRINGVTWTATGASGQSMTSIDPGDGTERNPSRVFAAYRLTSPNLGTASGAGNVSFTSGSATTGDSSETLRFVAINLIGVDTTVGSGGLRDSDAAQGARQNVAQTIGVDSTVNDLVIGAVYSYEDEDGPAPYIDGCLARYKLDETTGTTANDSSGNGYDLTLSVLDANDWTSSGRYDGGLNFPNDAGANTAERTSATEFQINEWFVSGWFNLSTASTDWAYVFSYGDNWGVYINRNHDGEVVVYSRYSSGWRSGKTSGLSLDDGNWHHILAGWNDTDERWRCWIDGTSELNALQSGHTPAFDQGTTANLGSMNGGRNWIGILDEVQIYPFEPTSAQLTALSATPPSAYDGSAYTLTASSTSLSGQHADTEQGNTAWKQVLSWTGTATTFTGGITGSGGEPGVFLMSWADDPGVSLTESLSCTDTQGGLRKLLGSVTEALSGTDTQAGPGTYFAARTDAAQTSENLVGLMQALGSLTDSTQTTDALSVVAFHLGIRTDSVAITDDLGALGDYFGVRSESVVVADALSGVLTGGTDLAESVTVTDLLVAAAALLGARTESVTISDALSAVSVTGSSLAETLTVSEVRTAVAALLGARTEAVVVTDVLSGDLTGPAVRSLTEAITIADTRVAIASKLGALTETVALTDALTYPPEVVEAAIRMIIRASTQLRVKVWSH